MPEPSLVLLFALLGVVSGTFCPFPGPQCPFLSSSCELRGLCINETYSNFKMPPEPKSYVTQLTVRDSTVTVLPSSFCEAYPQTNVICIQGVGMKYFGPNAFSSCRNLRKVVLSHNQLKNLDFSASSEDSLRYLQHLDLSHNEIKFFPTDSLPPLRELNFLDLSSNLIFDIDAETLARKTSVLEHLLLNQNFIRCQRLVKIREALPRIGLIVDESNCLDDVTWRRRLQEQLGIEAPSDLGSGYFDVSSDLPFDPHNPNDSIWRAYKWIIIGIVIFLAILLATSIICCLVFCLIRRKRDKGEVYHVDA